MTLRAPDGTELADDEKLPTYRSITNGSVLEMEVRSLLFSTPCLPCCCGLRPAWRLSVMSLSVLFWLSCSLDSGHHQTSRQC